MEHVPLVRYRPIVHPFRETEDGNIDFQRKRIENIASPYNSSDAVDKKTVDLLWTQIENLQTAMQELQKYNFGGHRLQGVGEPVNDDDGVPKSYVDAAIARISNSIRPYNKPRLRLSN